MRKIEVGQLFEEGKTKYQEGIRFDFDQSGGTLFIMFKNPDEKEIETMYAS